IFSGALDDLRARLDRLSTYPAPGDQDTAEDRVKFVTMLLAYGVFVHGAAACRLFECGVEKVIAANIRPMIECGLRAQYLIIDGEKANDFLDSDPFERWYLGSNYSKRRGHRKNLWPFCIEVLRRRPDLVGGVDAVQYLIANRDAILREKMDSKFESVLKQLRFPDPLTMIRALRKRDAGWHDDLYATIGGLGNQAVHASIIFLTDTLSDTLPSGHWVFDFSGKSDAGPEYLLQSAVYAIGMCERLGALFEVPDSMNSHTAEIHARHQYIADKLRSIGYIQRIIGREAGK
ncbi:MAG: hypothetical protein ACXVAO_16460, partial [Vulcanimicrobiaceae bacterium]